MRFFGIIILIRFSVETYALMLTTSRRQNIRMIVVILGSIFNCAINFYAIPHYGLYGAAFVSLLTNIFVGAGYMIGARQFFVRWTFNIYNGIPFVIAGLFFIILWNLREISFWYLLPPSMVVCMLVSYFFGYNNEERKLVFVQKFVD